MAIKVGDKYKCFYCGKEFSHSEMADKCRESHDLVYIPIAKSDLNKLVMYIMSGNKEILLEPDGNLIRGARIMMRYLKGNRS